MPRRSSCARARVLLLAHRPPRRGDGDRGGRARDLRAHAGRRRPGHAARAREPRRHVLVGRAPRRRDPHRGGGPRGDRARARSRSPRHDHGALEPVVLLRLGGAHRRRDRVLRQVLADRLRVVGADEEETLEARANLASTLWTAERQDEAIAVEEEVATETARIMGADHPDALTARRDLAASYRRRAHRAGASAGEPRRRPRAGARRRPPGDRRRQEDPHRELSGRLSAVPQKCCRSPVTAMTPTSFESSSSTATRRASVVSARSRPTWRARRGRSSAPGRRARRRGARDRLLGDAGGGQRADVAPVVEQECLAAALAGLEVRAHLGDRRVGVEGAPRVQDIAHRQLVGLVDSDLGHPHNDGVPARGTMNRCPYPLHHAGRRTRAADRGARAVARRGVPGDRRGRRARGARRARGRGRALRAARNGPRAGVEALREVLADRHGFVGDSRRYDHPDNSMLNVVLERRRGLPILLSVLYLATRAAAGIPLSGVGLPGHYVVGDFAPGRRCSSTRSRAARRSSRSSRASCASGGCTRRRCGCSTTSSAPTAGARIWRARSRPPSCGSRCRSGRKRLRAAHGARRAPRPPELGTAGRPGAPRVRGDRGRVRSPCSAALTGLRHRAGAGAAGGVGVGTAVARRVGVVAAVARDLMLGSSVALLPRASSLISWPSSFGSDMSFLLRFA